MSFHAIVGIIGYVWSKLKCRNSVTDCNNSTIVTTVPIQLAGLVPDVVCGGETPGPASGQAGGNVTYLLPRFLCGKKADTNQFVL